MNNPALRRFYENETGREAVKAFQMECLNDLAVDRVMKKEDTNGIADAKEIIENMFIKLEGEYGEKPTSTHRGSR